VDLDNELALFIYSECYNNGWNAISNVRVKVTATNTESGYEVVEEIDVSDRMASGEKVSWSLEIKDPNKYLVDAMNCGMLAVFTDYEWD